MRWRGKTAARRGRPHVQTMAVVGVAMMLAALAGLAPGASANGDSSTTICARFWQTLRFDGGTPASIVASVTPQSGYVVAVTVDLADFGHPEAESETGERVTVALGSTVVGTTPDLADDEVRRQFVLPVGQALTFDTITVTHAPVGIPDDLFIKTVCVTSGPEPSTTTSAPSTTADPATTTTSSPDSTTTTEPTSSSTSSSSTTLSNSTTSSSTTSAPTSSSSTTSAPVSSSSSTSSLPVSNSTSTSSTVPTDSSSTTTEPVDPDTTTPTTAPTTSGPVPTTVPGLGSFTADCRSGATDAGSFVWTASASVPDTVTPGDPLVVTDQVWRVVVPASLLENARQLGLVEFGDSVPVQVGATIAADGTVEETRSQSGLESAVSVVDAGDGSAAQAPVIVAADDMVFTPIGDRVEFRLAAASLSIALPGGAVDIECGFDPGQPPIVVTPPGEIAGPPPGELAVTGPNPLLVTAIVVFVLFDVGYLTWSATRPRRAFA